jgi:hypothetical protein
VFRVLPHTSCSSSVLLGLLLLLLSPGPALGVGGAPEVDVLIERVSLALGGERGGARVLEKAGVIDFTYRRSVKESSSGRKVTALHRFLRVSKDGRTRLDIRIGSGKGKDSATILKDGGAFLLVDEAVHEVAVGAVENRLSEFSPERLFSVPLALAADGPQLLGDAALTLAGRVTEGGRSRFILVGTGSDGKETARIEIDARSYRPVEVAFRSAGGDIVYRYADYRELKPGLILPFRREFIRNGILLSTTEVLRFEIDGKFDASSFDVGQSDLGFLPGVP